jgi:hypothetical protein
MNVEVIFFFSSHTTICDFLSTHFFASEHTSRFLPIAIALWYFAQNPMVCDQYGDHAGALITSAAFAPNGQWVATAGSLVNFVPIFILRAFVHIFSRSPSPPVCEIEASDERGKVKVWALQSKVVKLEIQAMSGKVCNKSISTVNICGFIRPFWQI